LSTEMRNRLLYAQAGILAASLEEGRPCPVCGSIHHPSPAVLTEDPPTEEQLKKLQTEERKALDKQQKAATDASSTGALQRARQDELDRLEVDLSVLPQLRAEKDLLKARIDGLKEQEKKLEELLSDISRKKNELEQIRIKGEASRNSLGGLQQEYARLEGAHTQALEQSGNQDAGILQREQKRCQTEADRLRDELHQAHADAERLERDLQQGKGMLAGLAANLEELKQQMQEAEAPETLQARQGELHLLQRGAEAQKDLLSGRLQGNGRILKQSEKLQRQIAEAGKRFEHDDLLSRTASGELKGQDKLAFEQYIQAFYFEHVLLAANHRLNALSHGQYTLLRRQSAKNMKSQTGLEMEVLDHYTGRNRPVSSLSGGESFLASLSLALGLSDVIQSFAGGIEVDAVFIDEGFGSLDHQALNQAMDALTRLSGGARMVGIISHVEELQERIPKQIRVMRTSRGSRLECISD
ncbi:MAG: hypothetical protein IJR36_08110, partial [Lachnospiraceae bacterium]|nr:hypothetical protein [Lachnospiraceae bacterium]